MDQNADNLTQFYEELSNDTQNTTFGMNTSSHCPMVTDSQIDLLLVFRFLLDGIVQLIISSLGVVGNLVSIFLLTRPEQKSCFNQLLTVLASFDLLYLFTMALESLRTLGLETDAHIFLFPYLLHPLFFNLLLDSHHPVSCRHHYILVLLRKGIC